MALARISAVASSSSQTTFHGCPLPSSPFLVQRVSLATALRRPARHTAQTLCAFGGRKQLSQHQGVNPAPGPLAPIANAPLHYKVPGALLLIWVVLRIAKKLTKRNSGSMGDLESRGLVDDERGRTPGKDPFYDDVMKNMNTVAFEELSKEQIMAARKRRSLERDADLDLSKVELPDNHPWAVKKQVDPQEEELQKARLNIRRGAPLQDLSGNRGFPDDKFKHSAGRAGRHSLQVAAAAKGGKQKFMWEALREATDEEMERDPTVLVMGEDVGHYGGSYKVTYDLYKKYGDMRLLDTPICENGFMGMGIGAAMTGLRPIVEGMNMGFLLLAYNQISNNAGMLHYTSGGQYKVPMVIRGPGGVGRQLGAEHSQRLESYFQSIPGVQLVAVSTTANAKALLKSAIRSDNPIIFFEHVLLYNVKGETHEGDYCQPLERAEMVRSGRDVTILCYSRMRYVVMQAVQELEKQGYDPEVVDLISLKPFDMETISNSVKKTRKVIIVEECMKTGGIGASLSAVINEALFDDLDYQVVRLSSQDVPTAYAYELEAATIVQPEQVIEAVQRVVAGTAVPA
ncbi:hypothetical protein WJX72_005072 [[Myrmecia] bisecta]|uniref:pyruvate dehydrogenase (acetyl-transferring) n=1 Tax=[Myrmecia] bisecta TaxID=41462 RepID=A0AAW1PCM5_9CHLO